MAFKALKACNFDRRYAPGEIIPDSAVYPPMVKQLKMMGKIADAPAKAPEQPTETPTVAGDTVAPKEGGKPSEGRMEGAGATEKPKKPGRKPKS